LAGDVAQPWLALHCQTLSGVSEGIVVLGGAGSGVLLPIACWPKREIEGSDLGGVVRAALAEGKVTMRPSTQPPGAPRHWSDVAVPFGPGSRYGGAVALRVEHPDGAAEQACERAVKHLRSGASWLEGLVRDAN